MESDKIIKFNTRLMNYQDKINPRQYLESLRLLEMILQNLPERDRIKARSKSFNTKICSRIKDYYQLMKDLGFIVSTVNLEPYYIYVANNFPQKYHLYV